MNSARSGAPSIASKVMAMAKTSSLKNTSRSRLSTRTSGSRGVLICLRYLENAEVQTLLDLSSHSDEFSRRKDRLRHIMARGIVDPDREEGELTVRQNQLNGILELMQVGGSHAPVNGKRRPVSPVGKPDPCREKSSSRANIRMP